MRFVLLLLLTSTALAGKPGFVPSWTKGQTWYVESRHTLLTTEGRTSHVADHFGPPMVWEYKVAEVRETGPLRYLQVLVRDAKGKDTRRAGLIFISELGKAGNPSSLALAKATFESPIRGELTRVTHDYRKESGGPHPVLSEDSLIPADVPCFTRSSMVPSAVVTYDITVMEGGLPFARDVVQTVKSGTPKEERLIFPGPTEPIAPRVHSDPSAGLDVTLERRSDNAIVHQLWNPAFPWWLYSRNDGGVSYLVPGP